MQSSIQCIIQFSLKSELEYLDLELLVFFLGSLRDRSQQRLLAQQLAESFVDEGAHQ